MLLLLQTRREKHHPRGRELVDGSEGNKMKKRYVIGTLIYGLVGVYFGIIGIIPAAILCIALLLENETSYLQDQIIEFYKRQFDRE